MRKFLAVFADSRMLTVLLLGFSSGLPFALTGATLQAWLSEAKLDLDSIGLFALVGLPYTLKFVWAPFLDRYELPLFGLRRGWGILAQIGLCVSIASLAFIDPTTNLQSFALVAFVIAFFSATQDIVVDAHRTESLDHESYGAGAGLYTTGYRVATVVSGGAALVMADHYSWQHVYLAMALLCLIGAVTLLFSAEPNIKRPPRSANIKDTIIAPFIEFFQRSGAMEILLFVMIYKLSTMMATALTTKFLLELGYSKSLIGSVNKLAGMIASISGTLLGGSLMIKFGLKRSLWIFGVIQAFVGLTFFIMPHVAGLGEGLREVGLVTIISMDNFMMGLGSAAIMGFMMEFASKQFTGTQYALLTSLTAVTRVILVAHAGKLVERIGWDAFFLATIPMAIPGLLLLKRYDHWQTSGGVKKNISVYDGTTVVVFIASLLALASDPFWRTVDQKDLGQMFVVAGAIGVLCVIAAGLLKPYILPGEARANS
jgi:PAT family beta-lactamase induction signal transducer AmpG